MQYSSDLKIEIEEAMVILNQMIENAEKQGAKNFDMLYTLKEALKELQKKVLANQRFDNIFFQQWDNIMGWAPRVFEDHPLLDLLRKIDKEVLSYQ